MKFQKSDLLSWVAIGLVSGGLVSCAGRSTKPEKTAPSAADKKTQTQPTGASKKDVSGIRLGEEVEVAGNTPVETTKTETRIERRSIPTIEERKLKANINEMSAEDFMALGLDQEVAEKVVRYRMQTGPFASVDDLENVPEMDLAWMDRLDDRLAAG